MAKQIKKITYRVVVTQQILQEYQGISTIKIGDTILISKFFFEKPQKIFVEADII